MINDLDVERALEKVENNDEIENIDENNGVDEEEKDDDYIRMNLFENNEEKKEQGNNWEKYRIKNPEVLPEVNIFEMMEKLNNKQREIVMHILNRFKTNDLPLKIFVSGCAGVGKSLLIKTIYHLILDLINKQSCAEDLDSTKIVLTAPTGKAAFLIGGNTLHSAFKLPLSGSTVDALSADITNTIRANFKNLKLIIIDEISMVGSTLFNNLNQRLQILKGTYENFGGISILLFGDFFQLPPVKDRFIFKTPAGNKLSDLINSPLWQEFEFFELTEVMRQKDDLHFVNALNNLATGQLGEQDLLQDPI